MPAAPTGDFYAVPDPLPPGPPGSPIWAERVAAPPGALAWRILYHSRTIHDEDIAVSGLVVAPDAAPPEGGFPVIAYAHGTTGLADPCAPSKAARPLADRADASGRPAAPAILGGRLCRRGDRLRRTRDAGAAPVHRRRQRGSRRPRQHPRRARPARRARGRSGGGGRHLAGRARGALHGRAGRRIRAGRRPARGRGPGPRCRARASRHAAARR